MTSRGTAFAYKGVEKPAGQVTRELSVRYIVEGSLRRVADRIRIAVRLIDALADHQLWAGHYEPVDLSSVHDEIVDKVLQAIEPQLYFAEETRASQSPIGNLGAWECIVRALSLMNSRPSSYSIMAATETIGLVIDAMRKIASVFIGPPAALSRKPAASA